MNDEPENKFAAARNRVAEMWHDQDTADLRAILGSEGGRRHVWALLEVCGVYHDSFRGEDTHTSSYVQGKRAVGLALLKKVFTADPNAYTIMRVEAAERLRLQELQVQGMVKDDG